jgi:hypothetical protein
MVLLLTNTSPSASSDTELQQLLTLRELISKRVVALRTPAPSLSPRVEPAPAVPDALQPNPVENGHAGHADLPNDHQIDEQEVNDLMDAEMDGAFEIDQEQAAPPSSSQSAPIAPMAPMMPISMAPVAPMAPMAFMKSSK